MSQNDNNNSEMRMGVYELQTDNKGRPQNPVDKDTNKRLKEVAKETARLAIEANRVVGEELMRNRPLPFEIPVFNFDGSEPKEELAAKRAERPPRACDLHPNKGNEAQLAQMGIPLAPEVSDDGQEI